jgi:hypothetical protein
MQGKVENVIHRTEKVLSEELGAIYSEVMDAIAQEF